MKVLVVYYSMYGNVYKMAKLVAEGIGEVAGAKAVVRRVPELVPDSVIESRDDLKAGRDMQHDVPLVTLDDFREADAIAFGTPTRYGNVTAQLKNQIDQLGGLWVEGVFEGKAAGVFTSSNTPHGGQETTALTLMAPLLHLGFVIVGLPYSNQELFTTKGGGTPYGPSHVAGPDSQRDIDADEATLCRSWGRRLAQIGLKLR